MRQHARDLAHAGTYLCCLGVFVAGVAYGAVATSRPVALFDWLAPSPDRSEPTRLSIAVANAREIREALSKPVPGPPPLPPITAKLAYGHLKPGGKDYTATAAAEKKPRLPKNGHDAMAMDVSPSFRARSAVILEMHKVY